MTADTTPTPPRPTGEAAWKAHRDAIEHRNNAAKKASNSMSVSDRAAVAREQRLDRIEEAQIRKLNAPPAPPQ